MENTEERDICPCCGAVKKYYANSEIKLEFNQENMEKLREKLVPKLNKILYRWPLKELKD